MKKPKKMPGPRASTAAAPGYASGNPFPARSVNLKIPMPPGTGPFGEGPDVDPGDSEALSRLRSLIDQELGWASREDEEGGDYESRLRQVGKALSFFGLERFVDGKVKQ